MTKLILTGFHVKRFRSLLDVKIDINNTLPVVICGENNIGKTNFLRALNLFFNHRYEEGLFSAASDIPHHIHHGSRGGRSKTELTGTFLKDDKRLNLKVTFNNSEETEYLMDGKIPNVAEVDELLSFFKFLYIESHNVDLPKLISAVLEKDGLLPLDTKRKKQSVPLKKLEEFITLSQDAISDIEHNINICFEKLTDFDGILKGKKIKINFAEFDKLRDVVKTMTSITLHDGNSHGIASKGSGAQRAVFLSLMQFISQNSKQSVIWGIDEPEAFLQPKLQKKVADVFHEIVSERKQPIILTTHSQHFVRLNELKSTYLFEGKITEREYKRRPNQVFYETATAPVTCKSNYEKASLIKKHLGINNNDGWEVLPYNILVEGEEDKKYLETLFQNLNMSIPNIVWSGGASKIGGYLQYYDHFASELTYKPEFVCIFDNDTEGREQSKKVKPSSYKYINATIVPLPRYDGELPNRLPSENWEIEDFLPPKMVLSIINKILRESDYKPIKSAQITDRNKPAHVGKQILKYAEECSNQNNSEKPPFTLDNDGRKKQLCHKLCEELGKLDSSTVLSDIHINFLQRLSK